MTGRAAGPGRALTAYKCGSPGAGAITAASRRPAVHRRPPPRPRAWPRRAGSSWRCCSSSSGSPWPPPVSAGTPRIGGDHPHTLPRPPPHSSPTPLQLFPDPSPTLPALPSPLHPPVRRRGGWRGWGQGEWGARNPLPGELGADKVLFTVPTNPPTPCPCGQPSRATAGQGPESHRCHRGTTRMAPRVTAQGMAGTLAVGPTAHGGSRPPSPAASLVPARHTHVAVQGPVLAPEHLCRGIGGQRAAGRGARVWVDAGREGGSGGWLWGGLGAEARGRAALCPAVRPVAAAARSGHARCRWPGHHGAGSTRAVNGSCWGQFRKRAGPCLGQAPQHPSPRPTGRVGGPG